MHIDQGEVRESGYNAFGYDPTGIIAHLCHHFFGPEWTPEDWTHRQDMPPTTVGYPCYGLPSPGQVKSLPKSFTPRPPPLYFGLPTPPYINGPRVFNPDIWVALRVGCDLSHRRLDASNAKCYKQVHGTEVKNGGQCRQLTASVPVLI